MNQEIEGKIDRLIQDYYQWGQVGFLAETHRNVDKQKNRQSVILWLKKEIRPFEATVLTLIASIQPILNEIESKLPPQEKSRFFAKIDHTSLTKSPESILEKMVREWDPATGAPQITFDNFRSELNDLGRFRIITNFLSDMERIKQELEFPYGMASATCTANQQKLKESFLIQNNRFADLINLQPDKRTKGERCFKGIFYPRKSELSIYKVEVQIQTQLQEAWDKKDHFLVYEPRRKGEKIGPSVTIEMFSMSELLYIADCTFDRLKKQITEKKDPQ